MVQAAREPHGILHTARLSLKIFKQDFDMYSSLPSKYQSNVKRIAHTAGPSKLVYEVPFDSNLI
jgi:hypothetical protein